MTPGFGCRENVGASTGSSKSSFILNSCVEDVREIRLFFGAGKAEGEGSMKDVLGGKGAGLAMTNHRPACVAGFTITTECCDYYLKHDRSTRHPFEQRWKKNRAPRRSRRKIRRRKRPARQCAFGSARSMPE